MRRLQQTITSSTLKRRSSLCPPTVRVVDTATAGLSSVVEQPRPQQYLILPHRRYSSTAAASRLPNDFLSILKSKHPDLKISLNKYDLDSHGHGESHHPLSPPDAVLYPSSVEEIQDILRLCCREVYREGDSDIPNVEIVSVIPYGAGTSLEGHLNFLLPQDDSDVNNNDIIEIPSSLFESNSSSGGSQLLKNEKKKVRIKRKGGISLDMCNFQSIGEVTPGDGFVKVGAGVTRNSLNGALRHTGMQFMIDPGADATLGGMTACGASGTAAVKYLTMRENVLSLTAVLPPRTISTAANDDTASRSKPMVVTCGSNSFKNSAGYNLPALFIGSEGTLGIITDVTVKIYPIPSNVIAASCAFDDLHTAAEAVTTIRMLGIPISRIELLDEISIRAFNQSVKKDELKPMMEEKATLFLEFSGHSESSVKADLSAAQAICVDDFQGSNFEAATDETTRSKLWAARHKLYYSSIALRGGGDNGGATSQSTIVTDVCVPLSKFADIISATAKDLRDMNVFGTCFGHAGDGNFHCILPLRQDDTYEYKENVFKVIDFMTERALSAGGTCTGEHGVGKKCSNVSLHLLQCNI
ncbi:hypothetical protein ACHAXM_010167 [Skeletonema potamos]